MTPHLRTAGVKRPENVSYVQFPSDKEVLKQSKQSSKSYDKQCWPSPAKFRAPLALRIATD